MTTQNQPLDDQPQETDDFDSAFDEFANKDSDEPREPAEPPAPDGESQDRGDSGGDDLADKLAKLETLEQENQRLKHSEASQRGRLGAYQRQINELQRQMQERQQAAQQAPQTPEHGGQGSDEDTQRQDMAESMGMDDWDAFKEDFPDMAKAFEARLAADRQERTQLEREVAELRSAVQPIQQQAQEQHLQAQEDALAARHPDWREVVAAPQFAEWLNQQPESLQRLTASDDAAEAAALLDMYQAQAGSQPGTDSRAATHDRRHQRLANAQGVSRRGAAPRSGAPDDFDAAFDHYAAKQARRR